MKRLIFTTTVCLAIVFFCFSFTVTAQAQSVKWQDIIGIIEGGNLVGSGTGQVTGAPGPWSASSGFAQVNLGSGNIFFFVRGLVLAAGNSIGTPGPVTQVTGTLVCDTDGSAGGGNSTIVDTPFISLSSQGNATFFGKVGPIPDPCLDEPDIAFLVRAFGNVWIGNGVIRTP
jgi:hypothetical protein